MHWCVTMSNYAHVLHPCHTFRTFVTLELQCSQPIRIKHIFTITAEIHACSLVNFYCQHADRHMNLKFMRHVSEQERAIQQFAIIKDKLMSFFNASVLLLMNFIIALSK